MANTYTQIYIHYYKDFAPTERAWPLRMSKLQGNAL